MQSATAMKQPPGLLDRQMPGVEAELSCIRRQVQETQSRLVAAQKELAAWSEQVAQRSTRREQEKAEAAKPVRQAFDEIWNPQSGRGYLQEGEQAGRYQLAQVRWERVYSESAKAQSEDHRILTALRTLVAACQEQLRALADQEAALITISKIR